MHVRPTIKATQKMLAVANCFGRTIVQKIKNRKETLLN